MRSARQDGQRLERHETRAGNRAGPAGLVAAPDRGDHRRAPGDGERLLEGGRPRGAAAGLGSGVRKTGHTGVHRVAGGAGKTGHAGVDRLESGAVAAPARPESAGECVRAAPGGDRRGAWPRPQRDGHLAGPRRSPRLHGPLRQRPPLRPHAAGDATSGRPPGHSHCPRRGGAGRLRRRRHGPPSAEREVSADAALHFHAGLQPQDGPPPHLEVEQPDLGGAARAGVSPARRRGAGRRPRQSQGRRPHAGRLRSGAQSALPRRPRALRCRRAAVPCPPSRSQGEGGIERRAHAAHAAARDALRESGGRPSLPRPLGHALGRHAHPRHDQAPGRGDVCGGAARTPAAPAHATAASRSTARTTARRPGM